jgi:hypothetical protein
MDHTAITAFVTATTSMTGEAFAGAVEYLIRVMVAAVGIWLMVMLTVIVARASTQLGQGSSARERVRGSRPRPAESSLEGWLADR